jgi:hypothetical protein
MTRGEYEPCEYCGGTTWTITATLIQCDGCCVLYGRCNGRWVLDPDTVPRALRAELARVEGGNV